MRVNTKTILIGGAFLVSFFSSLIFTSLHKNIFEQRQKRIMDSFSESLNQVVPPRRFNREKVKEISRLDFYDFFQTAGIAFAKAKKNPQKNIPEYLACLAVWASRPDVPVEITIASVVSFIKNFHLGGNDFLLLVAIAEIFEEHAFLKVTPEIKKEYEIALLRSISDFSEAPAQVATETYFNFNRVLRIFPALKTVLASETHDHEVEALNEGFYEKQSGEEFE